MKKTLLFLAAALCTCGLFAMASDCPEDAEKCCKEMKEKCEKKDCKDKKDCPEAKCPVKNGKMKKADCPQQKKMQKYAFKNNKKAPMVRRPRFKMSPEAKAEMEKFRAAVKEYKAKQTPENKAKVVAFLSKNFDKQVEMNKKRAESMRKIADAMDKKNAEMQKNRDAEIEKLFQRIMNPPKRPARKTAPGKKAPAAKPATKPAA